MPFVVVPSPPAQPRAISLVTAAHDATRDVLDQADAGRWEGGITYAPDNYGEGYTRDVCDTSTTDTAPLPAPSGVTATPSATGGTIAAGTQSYRVAALGGNGETLASTAATATTTGTTSSVHVAWQPVHGATSYAVFGRTGGSELHIADTAGTSYTDTGSITPSGALPSTNTTGGGYTYSNPAIVQATPFLVFGEDRCGTFGWQGRDMPGRATRNLLASTPKRVEHEFWTGELAQAQGYPNPYLTNGNATDVTPSGTPVSRLAGLQALEEALSTFGYGPRGMIHMPAQLVSVFGFVRREGNLLLTNLDTIVVPGSGYTGSDPNGDAASTGTAWLYATSMVDVRLSEPVLIPDPATDPDWRFKALDKETNDLVVRAERFAVASWDALCHFAVHVTLDA